MSDDISNRRRRTVLKAFGIALTGSVGLTGNAAAQPGNGRGRGRGSGPAYGEGKWATGQGSTGYCGQGYRRNHPHHDDETDFAGWEPGDGKPPWAGDDEDEDDDDEDDDDDDTGDGPPDDAGPPDDDEDDDDDAEEGDASLTITVEDQDGDVVAGIEIVGLGPDALPHGGETDEDGELELDDLEAGAYEFHAVTEGTEYESTSYEGVELEEDDDESLTVTVTDDDAEQPDDGEDEDEDDPDTPGPDPEEPEEPEEPDTPGPNPDDPDDPDVPEDPEQPEEPDDPSEQPEEPESVVAQIEQRIHAATNAYRAENDEDELAFNEEVAAVARSHSEDMGEFDYLAHTDPEGNGPGDRLDEAGVDCAGWAENIAYEFDSEFSEADANSVAESIVEGWISSSGHRQNILGNHDSEGVGVSVDGNRVTATQMFCSEGGS